jgi:hypothetical protein
MKRQIPLRPVFVSFFLTTLLGLALTMVGCLPSPPEPNAPGDSGLTGKYVGSGVCITCHLRIHDSWAATLHGGALNTLEAIGQDADPNCLACHTTGYGQPGGFQSRHLTNSLAGVGCETCHGPAQDHVQNVADRTLLPPKNISGTVCGQCHTGSHYPTFDQWSQSAHASVTPTPASFFARGLQLSVCGVCHSGDYREVAFITGDVADPNMLVGKEPNQMNAVTCAICHDPHARTGNAVQPDSGRDYQLRYIEVASPTPSNFIAATTDPNRFNICGQCHHDRGTTWQATDRGPHNSIQGNMYVGEMSMPAGQEATPLVPNQRSIHAFVLRQCANCHLARFSPNDPIAPASMSRHTFLIDFNGCVAPTCHPSTTDAQTSKTNLQTAVLGSLNGIAARLGDPNTWEYSSEGGPPPADQAAIPDVIKKTRFLYRYVLDDLSLGVHNPEYVRSMLREADALLTSIGK